MNEKKLKMMRYLRKNYYILSYSASKNSESLCSEFISIVNGGKGVCFLNQMNSCYLQVTNLMQLKCNSKGNLISSNLPSDNCSHLQSASFMTFSPAVTPFLFGAILCRHSTNQPLPYSDQVCSSRCPGEAQCTQS